MIRRLRLRNWQSYEDLDLTLDPGTTFVVAPNGVGKTSLVYGLAWAVFGQHSGFDPRGCIRAGAESAEVQVEVDLPDGRRLSVSRTAKRRGTPTATYQMGGARLTESTALTEMEQALGVELPVACRLSTMLGGGHIAARDTLDLEGHLHHAFGLTHLLGAVETAQSVAKEAEKAREALPPPRLGRELTIAPSWRVRSPNSKNRSKRLSERATELERVRDAAAAQKSLVERHLALSGQLERYEQATCPSIGHHRGAARSSSRSWEQRVHRLRFAHRVGDI